jgi:hypothetical protein
MASGITVMFDPRPGPSGWQRAARPRRGIVIGSTSEYLDTVERHGTALNYAAYNGHTAVRLFVMGDEGYEREQPTDDELARIGSLHRDRRWERRSSNCFPSAAGQGPSTQAVSKIAGF